MAKLAWRAKVSSLVKSTSLMSTPTARPWGECPLVLACELTAVQQGPTARSMPPIHHSTLTFTVRELLRGDGGFAVGSQLVVSHSARQLEPPAYPVVGAPCLLGAVKHAARGMVMRRMPGGGGGGGGGAEPQAECECLRLEERTDAAHADAVLGCSLPFGWSADGGAVRSPWADLGAAAWPPAEGSRVLAAADAKICSVTGRPVLLCGGGGGGSSLQLSGAMVPPASAEDATAVSRGGKPKGKWPGGWHEWTNPDGDGEYRLTLTNTGEQGDVAVPALLSVGGEPCWGASLLVEHDRRCHPLLPPGHAPGATTPPAALAGTAVQPTTLGPGESVSTVVNVLALEGPDWPRGGSRVDFNFWLGEVSCGPFSLYYMSSHHDVLRKEMGCADMGTDYQGES